MRTSLYLSVLLFSSTLLFAQQRHTISGYVREKGSQELLIGVTVYIPNSNIGTTTNTYGFYSITLPASDSTTLSFSFVGYEVFTKKLKIDRNQELNIALNTISKQLDEVIVSKKREEESISQQVQMSQIDVPIQQIKKIPTLLGEKDVMKVLQLMPGVQKGSEGQSGIYVRGGGPDQNLIILDDATVYNASHLFGFFSVFNGDALKSVELTKGGFPARYGGRLSSVIELNMKEGNKEKLHGEGGIGILSSRLTLEGPLKKNVSSFLISGRRTYADLLAAPFIMAASQGNDRGGYYFYDLNAKVNYDFGSKNKLYLSGYFGKDRFYFVSKYNNDKSVGSLDWGNATGTLRWNHLFSQKLFANTSLIFSKYQFGITSEDEYTPQPSGQKQSFYLRYSSGIQDIGAKYDIDYYPNTNHSIKAGVQLTSHTFTPSAFVTKSSDVTENLQKVESIHSLEGGVYIEDTWKAADWLKMNVGLRAAMFNVQNKTYVRPEPRLAMAFMVRPDLSFKASYAQMNQYVHMLSNTGIGLPTDLWVPTTANVKPQQSQQWAVGMAKDLKKGFSLTIEGYYKKMNNIINYKEGANFLLIEDPSATKNSVDWERNITAGQGWSYGGEVLLQKKIGKFSGWAGYTLSWTQWQFDALNFGKKFFPRYDRRHDISLVGIYEVNPRITLSATWVYGTGNALTMPSTTYNAYKNNISTDSYVQNNVQKMFFFPLTYGKNVNEYGEKNSFRAEAYHRADIGIQFHKKMKRHERTWEISFYNLYSRRNPFFYQIDQMQIPGSTPNSSIGYETVLKRYSIFPLLPSFSYNFKF